MLDTLKQIDPAFLILIIVVGIWILKRTALNDDEEMENTFGAFVLKIIAILVLLMVLIKYNWL